jgi:hypothetical protein
MSSLFSKNIFKKHSPTMAQGLYGVPSGCANIITITQFENTDGTTQVIGFVVHGLGCTGSFLDHGGILLRDFIHPVDGLVYPLDTGILVVV